MSEATTPASIGLPPLVERYNALRVDTLRELLACYAEQAHFKDPFNDVVGRAEIDRIFRHMFATLEQPTFVIGNALAGNRDAMLRWEFRFGLSGKSYLVPGSTALAFDDSGRVIDHVDYWDPTETVWAHLPLVGAPVRWLRRRFSSAHFERG
ncbi:MAG: nuclear transport factor 2 family protein [Burkholderiales bacterium]|jgi:hypothetical protein|uniref:nuclear transport factor 2 family protein n=1 Tax=Casimicrobium huifangae TaxID=2591109 RepID=UPI0012EC89ED|nr:nuclear transport factor 2 family protein [Casimicrobium huifangae]